MPLSDTVKTTDIISAALAQIGFEVKREFKVRKGFYVDLIGFKGNKAVLFEVKPHDSKLDQSDLMQVSSYIGALKDIPGFKDIDITGCVVALGGTIPPAKGFARDLNIHVIDSEKEKIETAIKICVSDLP